jgi:hypothetical protein
MFYIAFVDRMGTRKCLALSAFVLAILCGKLFGELRFHPFP